MARYRELLPTWADREGQYVVIFGDEVVGFFENFSDALAAGYKKVNALGVPFLAKQIATGERPVRIRGELPKRTDDEWIIGAAEYDAINAMARENTIRLTGKPAI